MTWKEFCDLVLCGNIADLEAAIAKHPEHLHTKDEYGFTALHLLMTEERPAAAEALLRAGADVHASNDDGSPHSTSSRIPRSSTSLSATAPTSMPAAPADTPHSRCTPPNSSTPTHYRS